MKQAFLSPVVLLLLVSMIAGCLGGRDDSCADVDCGSHGVCNPDTGTCDCNAGYAGTACAACADGYHDEGGECVAAECSDDADCRDGNACNGLEECVGGACRSGTQISCPDNAHCEEPDGDCVCDGGFLPEGGECVAGLEIIGSYVDNYGGDHEITQIGWSMVIGVYELLFHITYIDNQSQFLVAHNDGNNEFSPNLWSRFDWTRHAGSLWYCQIAFDVANESDARAATGADRTDPTTGGCGGGSWSRLDDVVVPTFCELPQAQVLSVIHASATLTFSINGGTPIQVGTSRDTQASAPDAWLDAHQIVLSPDDTPYLLKVFARTLSDNCAPEDVFSFVYEVCDAYPPAADLAGSRAVDLQDPGIAGWATGVAEVVYGEEVSAGWRTPEKALGPAQGTSFDIVCLGRGGHIVLTFDPPIADGPGSDLAVFENGFADNFLEFGLVEVSSDGEHFLRFDHAYLGDAPSGGGVDTTQVGSLAGKYRQRFGTPFDLAVFVNTPEVRKGLVDLQDIRYVKIVDLVGDGSTLDSFGRPIYDPYPTTGSAGFDLDAIAVLNASGG